MTPSDPQAVWSYNADGPGGVTSGRQQGASEQAAHARSAKIVTRRHGGAPCQLHSQPPYDRAA
eukprot:scaffold77744_cov56-Phaeocystis_antarctica.AAC.1